jgi:ApaG protein
VRRATAGYPEGVSSATTNGIKVTVSTAYVAAQSSPAAQRYVFAYTVRITNEGNDAAQLRSRHWVITDGNGKVEEVRGPGVVGQQPLLRPGEHFEYTSGCVLETPRGTMHGTYQMHRPDGSAFDAAIAPFALALPYSLN